MSSKASLESLLKAELKTNILNDIGLGGGGCISSGSTYETDHGRVFIKVNPKSGARTMFDGEYASLEALYNTNIVTVPKPIKVIDRPGGGAMLAMEYLEMGRGLHKYAATLGEQLARMHLQNGEVQKAAAREEKCVHKDGRERTYVDRFGFHINTCCGYLAMDNTWCDTWPTFYANKIEKQIQMIEQSHGDRQARELWNKVAANLSVFFDGLDITPALVHGDLWGGNAVENDKGPVIFDPASFYGHSEYDLGISYLFGGFGSNFFDAYHKLIPKAPGFSKIIFDPASFYGHSEYDLGISYLFGGFGSNFFDAYHKLIPKAPGFSKRKDLYKLFHYLNHWNHFGGGYQGSSISTLQSCVSHAYK